jgi:heme exporter protein D
LVATVLVLLAAVIIATASVLSVRALLRALLHREQRRKWDDLAARNRELDRELDGIWQRR